MASRSFSICPRCWKSSWKMCMSALACASIDGWLECAVFEVLRSGAMGPSSARSRANRSRARAVLAARPWRRLLCVVFRVAITIELPARNQISASVVHDSEEVRDDCLRGLRAADSVATIREVVAELVNIGRNSIKGLVHIAQAVLER